jgi:hypothetical protein
MSNGRPRKDPQRPGNLPVFITARTRFAPEIRDLAKAAGGTPDALSTGDGADMKTTIVIGMLGLALSGVTANAQTAVEQARILRDFEQSVVDYSQQHKCLAMLPWALNAATPAPRIFTLPVAMVFRQMIAHALAGHGNGDAIGGINAAHTAVALQPFPTNELNDFPTVLRDALPPLPDSLEYRLIGDDLTLRDKDADIIVGVLRDAVGNQTTVRR